MGKGKKMITLREFKEKMHEAKSSSGYDLYHRDFSSAMQHAYKHAKAKLGVDVDPEEIDSKVASGPRKPSKGKTNTYRLLDKGGKKAIQVQVYGMDNGKYELNMYKESVDVNEEMDPTDHVKEKDGKFCVYNKDGEVVAEFDNKKDACLLYTSPSPRDGLLSRMPSSA